MNGILYKRTPLRRIAETLHGALAQLGERMTGSHEVTGSIPISSTQKTATFWLPFFFGLSVAAIAFFGPLGNAPFPGLRATRFTPG